jgi:hypothetical protein
MAEMSEEAAKQCWCPCGCGCHDDEGSPCGKLLPNGLCTDCDRGRHEIPPPESVDTSELIRMHESILAHLIEYQKAWSR